MKISVDLTLCQDHGQCVFVSPDVFSFGADGRLVWIDDPGDAQRESVEDAADVCPMQAITVED